MHLHSTDYGTISAMTAAVKGDRKLVPDEVVFAIFSSIENVGVKIHSYHKVNCYDEKNRGYCEVAGGNVVGWVEVLRV